MGEERRGKEGTRENFTFTFNCTSLVTKSKKVREKKQEREE